MEVGLILYIYIYIAVIYILTVHSTYVTHSSLFKVLLLLNQELLPCRNDSITQFMAFSLKNKH